MAMATTMETEVRRSGLCLGCCSADSVHDFPHSSLPSPDPTSHALAAHITTLSTLPSSLAPTRTNAPRLIHYLSSIHRTSPLIGRLSAVFFTTAASYGLRIGVGVGIAALVALLILAYGLYRRRRRAAAFKNNYPVQPAGPQTQGVPMQSFHQQQPPYPMQQQPPYQPGYTVAEPTHYAPPSAPPPAASSSSPPQYQPPEGPPPAPVGAYDPTNVQNK